MDVRLLLTAFAVIGCSAVSFDSVELDSSSSFDEIDRSWYDDELAKLGVLDDTRPEDGDDKVQEEIQDFLQGRKEMDYQIEDNRSKIDKKASFDDDDYQDYGNEPVDQINYQAVLDAAKETDNDNYDEPIDTDLNGTFENQESVNEEDKKIVEEVLEDLAEDELKQEPEDFENVKENNEDSVNEHADRSAEENVDKSSEESVTDISKESVEENNEDVFGENAEENNRNDKEESVNESADDSVEQNPNVDENSKDISKESVEENNRNDLEDIFGGDVAKNIDDNNETVEENFEGNLDETNEFNAEENEKSNDEENADSRNEDDAETNVDKDVEANIENNFDDSNEFEFRIAFSVPNVHSEEPESIEDSVNENVEDKMEDAIEENLEENVNDNNKNKDAEQSIEENHKSIEQNNEDIQDTVDQNIDEMIDDVIANDFDDDMKKLFASVEAISDYSDPEESDEISDTIAQVYSDMKEDLDKLFATWDELQDSDSNSDDTELNIQAYEQTENRPFNEENILALRDNIDEKAIDTEVTSAELNDLMSKFAIKYGDDIDTESETFDKNVAAVSIHLEDDVIVVTSPNYPEPYPPNNIVDWVFDGQGMGIELNVTDFSVNGFVGDYLLIKPGGLDDSGNDGLIFSYNLNSERRYRFLDVNKMFVRFEAKPGTEFARGFSFSVRMISPPVEVPAPPEALQDPPSETLLVYVAGVTPQQFANISEEFRLIVADMATLYLNRAGDDIGLKTTVEVTQITQTAVCNTNWPEFHLCTAVRFGIPLELDDAEEYRMSEDDLRDMWYNMVTEDPFLARMRSLGITEFAVPSDESALLVWTVIGFGVVISAALLALALWRWSCFEGYTKMSPYDDTDSIISDKKRPLELYPAPHQNLPALYDDDFVKYDYDTTRVDMGGYANKSFDRDAVFDIDSEDDVRGTPKRDRFTTDV